MCNFWGKRICSLAERIGPTQINQRAERTWAYVSLRVGNRRSSCLIASLLSKLDKAKFFRGRRELNRFQLERCREVWNINCRERKIRLTCQCYRPKPAWWNKHLFDVLWEEPLFCTQTIAVYSLPPLARSLISRAM